LLRDHQIQTVDLEKIKLRHRERARAIMGLEP
jgi:hypothetical protein